MPDTKRKSCEGIGTGKVCVKDTVRGHWWKMPRRWLIRECGKVGIHPPPPPPPTRLCTGRVTGGFIPGPKSTERNQLNRLHELRFLMAPDRHLYLSSSSESVGKLFFRMFYILNGSGAWFTLAVFFFVSPQQQQQQQKCLSRLSPRGLRMWFSADYLCTRSTPPRNRNLDGFPDIGRLTNRDGEKSSLRIYGKIKTKNFGARSAGNFPALIELFGMRTYFQFLADQLSKNNKYISFFFKWNYYTS